MRMGDFVSVFINHSICESALRLLLKSQYPAFIIETISEADEVIPILKTGKYRLFILGINSSGVRGLKIVHKIRNADITIPILAVSQCSEINYGLRILKAGANAFVGAENSIEDLSTAINALLKGQRYLTPRQCEVMSRMALDGDALGNVNDLSEREFEVLVLIAEGKGMAEIGSKLNISNHTASTYRSRVMKKLALTSNVEMTHFAYRNGLI